MAFRLLRPESRTFLQFSRNMLARRFCFQPGLFRSCPFSGCVTENVFPLPCPYNSLPIYAINSLFFVSPVLRDDPFCSCVSYKFSPFQGPGRSFERFSSKSWRRIVRIQGVYLILNPLSFFPFDLYSLTVLQTPFFFTIHPFPFWYFQRHLQCHSPNPAPNQVSPPNGSRVSFSSASFSGEI